MRKNGFLNKKIGSHNEKVRFDSYLTSFIKINFISIIDINVKNQMIKLPESNIGEYIQKLMVEKDFLDKARKSINHKEKDYYVRLYYNYKLFIHQKVLESYSLREDICNTHK